MEKVTRTRSRYRSTATACALLVISSLVVAACSSSGGSTTSTAAAGGSSSGAANSSSTGGSNQKLQDVTIGLTSFNSLHIEFLVGRAEHLFQPFGVKVTLPTLQNDTLGIPGIVSGSLQFAPATAVDLFNAQKKTDKVKAVATYATGLPYVLMAGKDIKSVSDLKGKSIGVNAAGASLDYLAIAGMLAAQDPGLLKQIKFVSAGPPTARVAALSSGKVAAVGSFPPASLKLLRQGFHVVAKSGTYNGTLNGQFSYIVANPDWYNSHHDLAVKFMQGYLASIKWLNDPANKAEAVKDIAKEEKASTADASKTYDTFVTQLHLWPNPVSKAKMDPALMADAAEYFTKAGVKGLPSGASAMSGRYDTSLVEAALKAGI